jgi:FKBP-type peptidyl-prolyl cis-trans isomerase
MIQLVRNFKKGQIVLTRILVGIASLAIIGLIIGAVVVVHGGSSTPTASSPSSPKVAASSSPSAGLVSTDEVVGTGATATTGNTISVNYTGTLTDGTKFDSSYDRNQPFDFTLGGGQVIKGWDQGVVGMKVGGKRKLVIPPDLGYGATANGKIPANSTLIFEIELLNVK